MVPEPQTSSLAVLNAQLLTRCDALASQPHWRKNVPHGELFETDRAAGLALPGIGFDAVRFVVRKADKYGNITIDDVTYGAGPVFARRSVTVALRHESVEILDTSNQPQVVFTRSFDHQSETVIDPAGMLPLLARKPGAWNQSLIRQHMPDALTSYLDHATPPQRRVVFLALNKATTHTDFNSATRAADELIHGNHNLEPAAIAMLARRISQGNYRPAPEVDLAIYDTFTRQEQPA